MSPYTFSSTLHCTDGHIAGLASKLFFAEEFEESPLASVVSGVRLFSADEREAESTVAFVTESVSDELPILLLSACVDLILSLYDFL